MTWNKMHRNRITEVFLAAVAVAQVMRIPTAVAADTWADKVAASLKMNGADVKLFATLGSARIADNTLLERDVGMSDTSSGEAPLRGLVSTFIAVGQLLRVSDA